MKTGSALLLALGWAVSLSAASADDLAGHYVVADTAAAASENPSPGPETYGGTLDLAPRRRGYAATWHPASGGRRLRGLGLRDGDGLLALSVATGGAAYGVQVYHRVDGGGEWRGPWITSIDGAAAVGEIAFRAEGTLAGHHPLTCRRPGAGSFEGEVEIAAKGDDYLLTFSLGHSLLYRGLGVLLDGNRLVVGWSFGSPPAVAAYRPGADGMFAGRRAAWRSGQVAAVGERFARAGADAARMLPAMTAGVPAADGAPDSGGADLPQPSFGALTEGESAMLLMMEPGAPSVKAWNYDELQGRYAQDGWADRWLASQLTPEENALLRSAVRHRARVRARLKGKPGAPPEGKGTVGELIEAERQRQQAAEED